MGKDRQVPAVVTAGDRGAAKAVYGESKVFLELAGRALITHVVAVLQSVPEVSEVWVVGNAARLEETFERDGLAPELRKPLHILEQFDNLFENTWQAYRRLLPGAGPEGRDPAAQADLDQRVLYLSGDLPFATPQEISLFIERARERDSSYALGLVSEESMEGFYPEGNPATGGKPGIRMAYFNLREGRVRQSNLHLVKPGRIINRHYIQQMYQNRHQKEPGSILALAWRLFTSERGGLAVVWYYGLMHVAGIANRRGFQALADRIRSWIPARRIEVGVSGLLRASFELVVTDVGGCALDIDTEPDYDIAKQRATEWLEAQRRRAERLYGPLALPPPSARAEDAS